MAENKQEVAKYNNIADEVLNRIESLQSTGNLHLPANYAVDNHLKAAWLILQETTDRNGGKALDVCTKPSIANALFKMVLQGLDVQKHQCYFIVYGNTLTLQPSYFGTIALAKRVGGIMREPVANVIYEGDDFVYEIDNKTGKKSLVKHEQKLENIDNAKIKGAYAIVELPDGTTEMTLMSMQQIHTAWNQGPMHGNSPAHKNFPEEMAKKTVIGRACKTIVSTSDDAWMMSDSELGDTPDRASAERTAIINAEKQDLPNIAETEYEEIAAPKDEATSVEAISAMPVDTEDAPY